MNRRDFLAGMLGAGALSLVLKPSELIALNQPENIPWTLDDATFDLVHREAWRLLQHFSAQKRWPITSRVEGCESVISQRYPHQLSMRVGTGASKTFVSPAMEKLAEAIKRERLERFAQLPVQLAGARAASIGPLRYVVQYNVQSDTYWGRFDVLGGKR